MRMKKIYLWIMLAFICIAATIGASQYSNHKISSHEDNDETAVYGVESSSSVVSKVEPSNPVQLFTAAQAAEMNEDTEVTVYNNNLALVKEKRELDLNSGVNSVEYKDVAALIDPTSVMFEDTKNKDTAVLEQNYEYDLVSSQKLLEKFLDKDITVTETAGATYTGLLMSYEDGIVLKLIDGKVVTLSNVSKIEFPNSANLLTKPTLVWQVYSPSAGKRDVLTSYLTGGMSWKANYIIKTNADDTKADIQGWVSIDNGAGTTYEDAKLKLVAGEVHRAPVPQEMYKGDMVVEEEAVSEAAEGGFVEESLFEYHLYTLERPATLKNNQVKQLSLLSADSVPVKKELTFDASQSSDVQAVLNLTNSKEKGLGMPLPAGVMRVYKADSEGQLQFLGEDGIEHTPKDEDITVAVGSSFDVTGKKTQTNYKKVSTDVWRESYEIELKNHKSEAQTVKVVEHFYGDWEIMENSDTYLKKDAFTAEWEVTVPANGSKKVTYTVERSY